MGTCTSSSDNNVEKFVPIDTYKMRYRYKRFLHARDNKALKDFGKFQSQFLGSRKVQDEHWSNCVGRRDNDDTCVCRIYAAWRLEIEKILEVYEIRHLRSIYRVVPCD
jgi:hypothetical protein